MVDAPWLSPRKYSGAFFISRHHRSMPFQVRVTIRKASLLHSCLAIAKEIRQFNYVNQKNT